MFAPLSGAERQQPAPAWRGAVAVAATLALVAAIVVGPLGTDASTAGTATLLVASAASAAYLVWRVHPAWTLSLAFAGSMFTGWWPQIGLPGDFSPDRVLLAAGILAVLIRAPAVRDRAPLASGLPHWLMVGAVLWVVGSALAAHTLDERSTQFVIIDRFGVLPYLLYAVAPAAFPDARHRRILLGTLVAMGAYLGLIAVLEALGLDGLLLPRYIADDSLGFHPDRARGPFLEAVTNGAGLMLGALAALIAAQTWDTARMRTLAGSIGALCIGGLLFTETRSVWIGGTIAITVSLLAVREYRRWAVPALVSGVAGLAIAIAIVPGLAEAVTERRNNERTINDRSNLNRAALNMVQERPLTGFGAGTFRSSSQNYFRLASDYPLTAFGTIIHNVYLSYAAEIGVIGVALWVLALLAGVGAGLTSRGPPDLRPWRTALGCYALFFAITSAAVFPQMFPNLSLWLLAGVARSRT